MTAWAWVVIGVAAYLAVAVVVASLIGRRLKGRS